MGLRGSGLAVALLSCAFLTEALLLEPAADKGDKGDDEGENPIVDLLVSRHTKMKAQYDSEYSAHIKWLQEYTFEDFVRQFGRDYVKDSEEWGNREATFLDNMEKIYEHYEGEERHTWVANITQFADWTEKEFKGMLGLKHALKGSSGGGLVPLEAFAESENVSTAPQHRSYASLTVMQDPNFDSTLRPHPRMDWKKNLGAPARRVPDQGGCGSCWAFAAFGTLEAQLMKNPALMSKNNEEWELAKQEAVDCSPNPESCGGTGGCQGSIVELAYESIKLNGTVSASAYRYEGADRRCKLADADVRKHPRVLIGGYVSLERNNLKQLMQAVSQIGPIAISVAANSWNFYFRGVFASRDCRDFVVNHAVILYGYGTAPPTFLSGMHPTDFWLVRNSWGQTWGEKGFIRLERLQDEQKHCGWDDKPGDGIACKPWPQRQWFCGTCGILAGSVYPTGVRVEAPQ